MLVVNDVRWVRRLKNRVPGRRDSLNHYVDRKQALRRMPTAGSVDVPRVPAHPVPWRARAVSLLRLVFDCEEQTDVKKARLE
jgi:hypothetical protein